MASNERNIKVHQTMSALELGQPMRTAKAADVAMRAVLETTELLEMILLRLPPRDAIVSMRVCRRWNQCIHASPSMPQHLFLQPSGANVRQILWQAGEHAPDYFNYDWDETPPRAFIPASAILKPAATFTTFVPPYKRNFETGVIKLTPVRLCPLLNLDLGHQPTTLRLGETEIEGADLVAHPDRLGSWASMLLTDPPCVQVEVITNLRHSEHPRLEIHRICVVTNPDGVTVRDLAQQSWTVPGPIWGEFPREWGDDIEMWPTKGERYWHRGVLADVVREVTDHYGGCFEGEPNYINLSGAILLNEQKDRELLKRGEL